MTYTNCITVYRGDEVPKTPYKKKRDYYQQLKDCARSFSKRLYFTNCL